MLNNPYSLFSVYGIEIEYMIVNKDTLDVLPICDKLLFSLDHTESNEVSLGKIAASNELALHVIELKTNGPTESLEKLDELFHQALHKMQPILKENNAVLMPTGMHPWFNPEGGFCLWPHGDKTIYNTYHRIFNCSGHGWSNLQSTHINLPFATDEEFAKLHSAIRFILPIIPAFTASTPFMHGQLTKAKDTRLEFYGKNQKAIPKIAGEIIPEFVTSEEEYEKEILLPMYESIHSHDPDKVLQEEWLNSRGAIARFDRSAIEIRVMDSQECPKADIACVNLITTVIRYLVENQPALVSDPMNTTALKTIYISCIEKGMDTGVDNSYYLEALGYTLEKSVSAHKIWSDLFAKVRNQISQPYQSVIETILEEGSLSERLLNAYHKGRGMREIYQKLCDCLNKNELFHA